MKTASSSAMWAKALLLALLSASALPSLWATDYTSTVTGPFIFKDGDTVTVSGGRGVYAEDSDIGVENSLTDGISIVSSGEAVYARHYFNSTTVYTLDFGTGSSITSTGSHAIYMYAGASHYTPSVVSARDAVIRSESANAIYLYFGGIVNLSGGSVYSKGNTIGNSGGALNAGTKVSFDGGISVASDTGVLLSDGNGATSMQIDISGAGTNVDGRINFPAGKDAYLAMNVTDGAVWSSTGASYFGNNATLNLENATVDLVMTSKTDKINVAAGNFTASGDNFFDLNFSDALIEDILTTQPGYWDLNIYDLISGSAVGDFLERIATSNGTYSWTVTDVSNLYGGTEGWYRIGDIGPYVPEPAAAVALLGALALLFAVRRAKKRG